MHDLKKAAADLRAEMDKRARRQGELRDVAEVFRQRYRAWCLDECETECARDFRLVRLVRTNAVSVFLDYIGALDSNARRRLVVALSKRLNWEESLSSEDQQICERYIQFFTVPFVHPTGKVIPSARVPAEQLALQDRFSRRGSNKRLIRQSIREHLKKTVTSELGNLILDRPSVLWFEKKLAPWYVVTAFDLSDWSQLRYTHTIYASPGGHGGTNISSGISILNWIGIDTLTTWSWLVSEDIPPTVQALCELSDYFLQAAKTLLADLKPPTGLEFE